MSSTRSRLDVKNLEKTFAELTAVAGVDLHLTTGEILGLIGPNGSGKTTLINLMTGLLPKTAGSVVIGDTDVSSVPAYRVARAGLVRTFQTIRLFHDLTCIENVQAGAVGVGISLRRARELAHELLGLVGLSEKERETSGSLSFGDQRRLEIARALATRPKFLLLDEPAAGLNADETDQLHDFLRALPEMREIGILIVDHDMRLMLNLCDRLQVLNFGRTIAEGPPEAVRADPLVISAYLGATSHD